MKFDKTEVINAAVTQDLIKGFIIHGIFEWLLIRLIELHSRRGKQIPTREESVLPGRVTDGNAPLFSRKKTRGHIGEIARE